MTEVKLCKNRTILFMLFCLVGFNTVTSEHLTQILSCSILENTLAQKLEVRFNPVFN